MEVKRGVKWGVKKEVKKEVKEDNTFCNNVVDKRIVHFNFLFYFHLHFSLLYVTILISLNKSF